MLCDAVCGQCPADVIIADYEAAQCLAQNAPQWVKKLLVFTSCDTEAKICRALESGISGYLLYGVGLRELFEAMRSVHGGGVALSPLVAARIANRVQSKTLTVRENAVLEQLMLGLSNKEIANRLNVGVGTVKTHVKSILGKLGAESRTAAAMRLNVGELCLKSDGWIDDWVPAVRIRATDLTHAGRSA